ncbi:MAG: TlpA family protein disulfide reductase [Gammaproteobacteria bacterium]|nr:TlpA family protein disulfide reductase [Gammaproteobacteria bacterium]
MTTRNLILFTALLASSAVAGYMFYAARPNGAVYQGDASARQQVVGSMRPVFSLPDITGNDRSITEWDGKALVVNFWATWCPPCLREIPMLIDASDELATRDIQIIGIAMDDPDAVREFAAQNNFNYPILVGEQEAIAAAEAFGADVIGLPLTVFTDHAGRVIEIHPGELNRDELDAAIATLQQ